MVRLTGQELPWLRLMAVLNGVYGDALAEQGSPLAMAMTLRDANGQPCAWPEGSAPIWLYLHGLCGIDTDWHTAEHATWVAERAASAACRSGATAGRWTRCSKPKCRQRRRHRRRWWWCVIALAVWCSDRPWRTRKRAIHQPTGCSALPAWCSWGRPMQARRSSALATC